MIYTTKRSKVMINYSMFMLRVLHDSTTNHAFSLAMPIEHTYQCHVQFSSQISSNHKVYIYAY